MHLVNPLSFCIEPSIPQVYAYLYRFPTAAVTNRHKRSDLK